jgi:cell division protease FtsH
MNKWKWILYAPIAAIIGVAALLVLYKVDQMIGLGLYKAISSIIGSPSAASSTPEPSTFAPPSPSLGLGGWLMIIGTIASVGILILLILNYLQTRRMMGYGSGKDGKGGPMGMTRSNARQKKKEENTVRFTDVAGCDESVEEVRELVDFLRDPAKFGRLGGRSPRGVLLVGSSGTGKTLLARAIAGEAKAEFFFVSGSDFVEIYVGVGAGRVRSLFEQAKKAAPAIIFIDEIDAVGRKRGAGAAGGNEEREQTLNQILVEMDGFEQNSGVVVIAATNRPDILDPAILRPGRFDRHVVVPLPDILGREKILEVHTRKIPLAPNVRLGDIARGTSGFSGADLANLANEAALVATKRGADAVDNAHFELAKDKVIAGTERKHLVISDEERRITAYHESGHAVVACALSKYTDPVHKVSIIPRMMAAGVTIQLPTEDRRFDTKERLLAKMAVYYGGRIAEEMFIGDITTGASHDYTQASEIARNMVLRYAMTRENDELGQLCYFDDEGGHFLGRSAAKSRDQSESTMQKIDRAVHRIASEQYAEARRILEEHREKVVAMAEYLLTRETLNADDVLCIMRGETLPPIETEAEVAACSPEH